MTQSDVLEILPQKPPFVMIDEIVKADGSLSKTNFTIREGHLFVKNGYFTEAGIVENIAQTAAAGNGLKAQIENTPVKVGYIGALKNLSVSELPMVGDLITTEVSFLHQVLNVHIVQGRVYKQGNEIATCELKIFLQAE